MTILTLAGFSAVGKQTTIRRLLAGDEALRQRFGVSGQLYATGYAFGPLDRARCAAADTVLVQWQAAEHGKLATLRAWFPQAEHRTLWLLRDWTPHLASHQARYGHRWTATGDDLRRHTLGLLRDYFDGQVVEIVRVAEVSLDARAAV